MRYLKNPNTDPYFNMAFDEYCLNSLSIDEPVFFLLFNFCDNGIFFAIIFPLFPNITIPIYFNTTH